jgi:hypothetical protein
MLYKTGECTGTSSVYTVHLLPFSPTRQTPQQTVRHNLTVMAACTTCNSLLVLPSTNHTKTIPGHLYLDAF